MNVFPITFEKPSERSKHRQKTVGNYTDNSTLLKEGKKLIPTRNSLMNSLLISTKFGVSYSISGLWICRKQMVINNNQLGYTKEQYC